jgi:hypothetical protein
VGFVKNQLIQESDQGWSFSDQHVCAGCVNDYALQAAVRAAEDADEVCDFCGSSPAAELDVLLDAFVNGLRTDYGDADDEGVYYESAEGGYQWSTMDTWDLVGEFFDVFGSERLFEAVRDAVEDRTWVEVGLGLFHENEALLDSWKSFCEEVQYKTRYVFWLRPSKDDEHEQRTGEVPASRILDKVGLLINELGLVQQLPARYRLWRARPHREPVMFLGASELGTAPRECAMQANRMSPAGIPMFYGAEDMSTAVREATVRTPHEWVTVAAFETSQPCTVINFTSLQPVPSMFDLERARVRRPLMFLHAFVRHLSEPARETYEQIDYVPTQIVTEYLLRIFGHGELVKGLLYKSSLTGGVSAVLDVPNDRCVEREPGWAVEQGLRLGLLTNSAELRSVPPRL